jgi:hypothetical protein
MQNIIREICENINTWKLKVQFIDSENFELTDWALHL